MSRNVPYFVICRGFFPFDAPNFVKSVHWHHSQIDVVYGYRHEALMIRGYKAAQMALKVLKFSGLMYGEACVLRVS